MKNLSPLHAESRVSWLAHTASACLIDEARLSPKPGLVDSRGNGAHQDLNLALMERSARSLQPTFHALELANGPGYPSGCGRVLCAHDVLLAEDTPVKVLDKLPVIVNRWQTRNWNQAREKSM